jgi:hypothetical protein
MWVEWGGTGRVAEGVGLGHSKAQVAIYANGELEHNREKYSS